MQSETDDIQAISVDLVPAVDQNGTGALQWLTGCMRSNSEHKVEQHGSVLGTTKIGPGDEMQVLDNTLLLTLQPYQLHSYLKCIN